MNNKQNILITWLGLTDIKVAKGIIDGLGPIAQAVEDRSFKQIHIISNSSVQYENLYKTWIKEQLTAEITIYHFDLSSPTEYGEIFDAAKAVVEEVKSQFVDAELTYHLSPGTPAMSAVWILMAKSNYPAELIDSSIEQGVRTVNLPFEVYANFLIESKKTDKAILNILELGENDRNAFSDIIHKSEIMKFQIGRAAKIAKFDFPVVIQGESGTGKELFARAIHKSSKRHKGPYKILNCGAIPSNLIEAELFGYEKGAFTGASSLRKGIIESTDGGTLFLDEIGEMPLDVQVKLLRTLQEKSIKRIGSNDEIKVDFRVLVATNRNLLEEIQNGSFREDLFHRLAIGIINLPPLRERKEDINILTDYFLDILNGTENQCKKISISARNLMLTHNWPGNVRELDNTIKRIFIWSMSDVITNKDIEDNLFHICKKNIETDNILNREVGREFNVNKLLNELEIHYIKKAFKLTDKKVKAAELLGYNNHQTLKNRMEKLGLE